MDIAANTWNDRERRIYEAGVLAGHSDVEVDIEIFVEKIRTVIDGYEPREVGSADGCLGDIVRLIEAR